MGVKSSVFDRQAVLVCVASSEWIAAFDGSVFFNTLLA